MKKTNFLDKTFNLAGLLLWGVLGMFLGLMLGGVLYSLFNWDNWYVLTIPMLAMAVILGLYGAKKEPSGKPNSKFLNAWLRIENAVFFIGLLKGKLTMTDRLIPERITVRSFLIWLVILVVMAYILFNFPAVEAWVRSHSY